MTGRPATTNGSDAPAVARRTPTAPLFLAGFTTAFGAHSVAAAAGTAASNGVGLFGLAALLAVYDLAEVLLKPVFGSLADRIGPKPVIVGGLLAFAVASLGGVFAGAGVGLIVVRFGQGASASAFSPASSAAVARFADRRSLTRAFGRYGSWKGLGYAFGPILGAVLVSVTGWAGLALVLAGLALLSAVWVAIAVPSLPPLPRRRSGPADLVRRCTSRPFLVPTSVLAAAAGTVAAAVGFLPAVATHAGLSAAASATVASVLAVASSLTQPTVGRLIDSGRLRRDVGIGLGSALIAAGLLVAALAPSAATLYLAGAATGLGVALITPTAFGMLAASVPPERVGGTMGAAEVVRELGDAGAPALVGVVAVVAGLPAGLVVLAAVVGAMGGVAATSAGAQRRGRELTV